MTLPLGVSVPHGGLLVPPRLAAKFALSPEQVVLDGDVGAAEIYDLADSVAQFVAMPVARAVLDMNRAADDIGRVDGVVKVQSCWQEPVWQQPLEASEIQWLLRTYHEPYHQTLSGFVGQVRLGIDCHTMAEFGPPVGPDEGVRRPLVCLGDGAGTACPREWIEAMRDCMVRYFGDDVTINKPFAGGYTTRFHGKEMPWMQIELSRTDQVSIVDKRRGVLAALRDWCAMSFPNPTA